MSELLDTIGIRVTETFAHPLTGVIVLAVGLLLVLAPLVLQLLRRGGFVTSGHFAEMWLRWKSWIWLSMAMMLPILLGPEFVAIAAALLGLFCYHEFSRASGLCRERSVSVTIVLGILALAAAQVFGGERWFHATAASSVMLILLVSIPSDQPKGFLQRVGLGVLAFMLFGYCIGYLGLLAREPEYRPLLLLLLLAIELNDISAYCFGRLLGRHKLLPQTSQGKTMAGFIGALVFTTALVAAGGFFLFRGADLLTLLILGMGISLLGQFGDLLVSSIKRDLGTKDFGVSVVGHGGVLDRFDSLLLVPPALYYLLAFLGAGTTQPMAIAGF